MMVEGSFPKTKIIMGHMTHRFCFNENFDSVKQLRHGVTKVTVHGMSAAEQADAYKEIDPQISILHGLCSVKDLQLSLSPFDEWLRYKLPEVIFNSVVEPVCALLDIRYKSLLKNKAAQRAMELLLSEIIRVIGRLPEIEGSYLIRSFLQGDTIHRALHKRILSKKSQPSLLLRRVKSGLPTDVDYMNGFFLRRGKALGIDTSMNNLVKDLINAKHASFINKTESYVPLEQMSELFGV
ncbi:hypothetical protein CDD81_7462 [Ophiocordyceps australis]|uniref:Ketopantoate reductase C-terminal domain-containing protein n=1 Tax=Ophiocordyceps australis TaxID=1399860 RepID=A0A2C5YCG3_9HYPO|nr:hypothetical protein CDD81_7462 [Ophiocordyceps australis]